jgi:hypothetical protein
MWKATFSLRWQSGYQKSRVEVGYHSLEPLGTSWEWWVVRDWLSASPSDDNSGGWQQKCPFKMKESSIKFGSIICRENLLSIYSYSSNPMKKLESACEYF